ncbi:MAG: MCE family protein [Azoarcus sp.]|jgi:phospholipid/cholesterol/gamma-HCH transport system substrate-binding protein|nr:MCE family protein [Azoarcus sp.]
METRAHHILIGLFAVAALAAALLFALWLGKSGSQGQFSLYEVIFTEAVSGLSQGSAVEFNGIRIGSVADLRLDPDDPRKVRARIRIDSSAPIRTDTRARLNMTGVTGLSNIRLSSGDGGTPLTAPPGELPVIPTVPSSFNKLLASGGDVISNAAGLLAQAQELFSPQNIANFSRSLEYLEQTTGALAAEREDMRRLLRELARASGQTNTALEEATRLLVTANRLIDEQGQKTLDSAQGSMAALERAMRTIDTLLADNRSPLDASIAALAELGPAIAELRDTLASLRAITRRLEDRPADYLLGLEPAREFQP